MKTIFLSCLLLLIMSANAQDTLLYKWLTPLAGSYMFYDVKLPQKLNNPLTLANYNRAFDLYFHSNSESDIDTALMLFKHVVATEKNHGNHLYAQSFLFIGGIYYGEKNFDSAMVWYEKLLLSDIDDRTQTGDIKGGCFGNYKYEACFRLSGIYGFYKQDIKTATAYLDNCETKYPFYDCDFSSDLKADEQTRRLTWRKKLENAAGKGR